MKILLIDPPFYRLIGYYNRYFPLGLCRLAAKLRQLGHTVRILDCDANLNPKRMDFARLEDSYPGYLRALQNDQHESWDEIRSTITSFSPDIVGISIWTTYAASAFKVASISKTINRTVPVIVGGPHATLKADEVLRICPDIDLIVRGEGEETLPELVRHIHEPAAWGGIEGISFRSQQDTIAHNPGRSFIANLDSLPLPARDLLIHHDTYDSEDMGLIMGSRGCPFDCGYCATSIWERKVRYRSIANILGEITSLVSTYGTNRITFKDDSFTVNRRRVMDFCAALKESRIRISWDCNARADNLDEEMLRAMKSAGCDGIKVGIESGSERILTVIRKKISRKRCLDAAHLCRKVGLHWTGYFMIGLPTETKDEMMQTLAFMKELDPDYASLSVYEPFPGTQLFDMGIEKGLVKKDRTLADFNTISPKHYYVKDLHRRIDTMSNAEFDATAELIRDAFHSHNRRPSKLIARVVSRSALYAKDPRFLWRDFRKFVAWI